MGQNREAKWNVVRSVENNTSATGGITEIAQRCPVSGEPVPLDFEYLQLSSQAASRAVDGTVQLRSRAYGMPRMEQRASRGSMRLRRRKVVLRESVGLFGGHLGMRAADY